MTDRTFEPGEHATMIVGLPGPDMGPCEVLRQNEDGTYQVRFQVHGEGPWHECTAHPGKRVINGLFKTGKASK